MRQESRLDALDGKRTSHTSGLSPFRRNFTVTDMEAAINPR